MGGFSEWHSSHYGVDYKNNEKSEDCQKEEPPVVVPIGGNAYYPTHGPPKHATRRVSRVPNGIKKVILFLRFIPYFPGILLKRNK